MHHTPQEADRAQSRSADALAGAAIKLYEGGRTDGRAEARAEIERLEREIDRLKRLVCDRDAAKAAERGES